MPRKYIVYILDFLMGYDTLLSTIKEDAMEITINPKIGDEKRIQKAGERVAKKMLQLGFNGDIEMIALVMAFFDGVGVDISEMQKEYIKDKTNEVLLHDAMDIVKGVRDLGTTLMVESDGWNSAKFHWKFSDLDKKARAILKYNS
jgi:hypothetical protein